MKRLTVLLAILSLVVPMAEAVAAAPPGRDLLTEAAIHQVGKNARVGSEGWRSYGGQSDTERNFLEYSLQESGLKPDQGTVIIEVERGEVFVREALFSLVNDNYDRKFVFRVFWDGVESNGGWPYVGFFYHPGPGSLWVSTDPEPLYPLFYAQFNLPLPRKVAHGEKVRFAITWGGGRESRIYFDGKPLATHIEGVSTLPLDIAAATKLIVGAETDHRNPQGAWSMTSSLIRSFRVLDMSLSPEEVASLDGSAIRSVTHDAFDRAGYSGKLVAGDTVGVTLVTDPGGAASFEVVQPGAGGAADRVEIAPVPLAEDPERPGTYRGSYSVRFGDSVTAGRVVGRFVNAFGIESTPLAADRPIEVDGTVHFAVSPSNELIPADRSSRSGLTIVAKDANGRAVRDHQLKLTVSTTDEYTGTVGGGTFEEAVGGTLEVDWKGITDSFGEVTAQYVSGFAAKTILVSAKDMVSGDVGVGWVRSFIDGTVDIVVKRPESTALAFAGTMEITASRTWLTADGKSRSRITAVVKDESGAPMAGHNVQFTMAGDNGALKVVQSRTDGRGRAYADYVAGTVMGQVTIDVVDTTSGLSGSIVIELRPDAPAEITLVADPGEVVIGGDGATVTATVKDINGNPNRDVDVVYDVSMGEGTLASSTVATDEKGVAAVRYTPGGTPGVVTIRGTVTSRVPTSAEVSAAQGAAFLYGLSEDPGPLTVGEWRVAAGDEVVRGQELVVLTDRDGASHPIKALRDGKVSVFAVEEGDEVNYGDTLVYILLAEEK